MNCSKCKTEMIEVPGTKPFCRHCQPKCSCLVYRDHITTRHWLPTNELRFQALDVYSCAVCGQIYVAHKKYGLFGWVYQAPRIVSHEVLSLEGEAWRKENASNHGAELYDYNRLVDPHLNETVEEHQRWDRTAQFEMPGGPTHNRRQ